MSLCSLSQVSKSAGALLGLNMYATRLKSAWCGPACHCAVCRINIAGACGTWKRVGVRIVLPSFSLSLSVSGALCLRSRRRVLLPLLIIICTVNVCVHICISFFLSTSVSVYVCVHKHTAAVEAWLASSLWLWTITQLQSVIMWEHGCCFVIIFAEHSLCRCRLIMIIVLCTADPYLSLFCWRSSCFTWR